MTADQYRHLAVYRERRGRNKEAIGSIGWSGSLRPLGTGLTRLTGPFQVCRGYKYTAEHQYPA